MMVSLHPGVDVVDALHAVGRDEKDLIRSAFGRFPTGIVAVSARTAGEEPAVLIASSFQVGISLDPPLVLFAVRSISTSWPRMRDADRLGVSVLDDTQSSAVRSLSVRGPNRFAGTDMITTPTGAHLLRGSAVWLETSVHSQVPAGDHDLVLLQVHGIATLPARDPLVWYGSAFRSLAHEGDTGCV